MEPAQLCSKFMNSVIRRKSPYNFEMASDMSKGIVPLNRSLSGLPTRLQRLFASAAGLSEPRFDVEMRIANWPETLSTEVKQLTEALRTSRNDIELRTCAEMLNATPPEVPDGLLMMLSRAVFDNPNTPLRHDD